MRVGGFPLVLALWFDNEMAWGNSFWRGMMSGATNHEATDD